MTPLGAGWTLNDESIITAIETDSQVARAGNITLGDQVLSINGASAKAALGFPTGTRLDVQLVSAEARQTQAAGSQTEEGLLPAPPSSGQASEYVGGEAEEWPPPVPSPPPDLSTFTSYASGTVWKGSKHSVLYQKGELLIDDASIQYTPTKGEQTKLSLTDIQQMGVAREDRLEFVIKTKKRSMVPNQGFSFRVSTRAEFDQWRTVLEQRQASHKQPEPAWQAASNEENGNSVSDATLVRSSETETHAAASGLGAAVDRPGKQSLQAGSSKALQKQACRTLPSVDVLAAAAPALPGDVTAESHRLSIQSKDEDASHLFQAPCTVAPPLPAMRHAPQHDSAVDPGHSLGLTAGATGTARWKARTGLALDGDGNEGMDSFSLPRGSEAGSSQDHAQKLARARKSPTRGVNEGGKTRDNEYVPTALSQDDHGRGARFASFLREEVPANCGDRGRGADDSDLSSSDISTGPLSPVTPALKQRRRVDSKQIWRGASTVTRAGARLKSNRPDDELSDEDVVPLASLASTQGSSGVPLHQTEEERAHLQKDAHRQRPPQVVMHDWVDKQMMLVMEADNESNFEV